MRKRLLTAFAFILTMATLNALEMPYAFRNLGTSAKAPVTAALLSTAEGAYVNPSGLAFAEKGSMYLYSSLPFASQIGESMLTVESLFHGSFSLAIPFHDKDAQADTYSPALGFSLISFVNGGNEAYDESGVYLGEFSTSEWALSVSGALPLRKNVSLGASLSGIGQFLHEENSFALSLGISASWRVNKVVSLSLNAHDIFTTDVFKESPLYTPQVSMAASVRPFEFWTISTSLDYQAGNLPTFALATEFIAFSMVHFRVGYDFSSLINETPINTFGTTGIEESVSETPYGYKALEAGVGVEIASRYEIDYLFSLSPEFAATHSVGFRYMFK